MGFAGDIWPVHPRRMKSRASKPTVRSPTCPARRTPPSSASTATSPSRWCGRCARRGAGGAICFASGFLETGDYDADGERLQERADRGGRRHADHRPELLRPDQLCRRRAAVARPAWRQRLPAGARGAAIITQSSNIACNLTMQKRGLPVAFLMTAGNQAQTGLSEMALGLIEDERVSVARPAHRGVRLRRRLRAAGGACARTEKADRRHEGRPLGAGARGDDLAHGFAGRFGCGFRRLPEAARHCARRHDPVLPRRR